MALDIVFNSRLDIGNMVVEHNQTEDKEERIAWFLKSAWELVKAARWHTILHSVYSIDAPRGSR